METDIRKTSSKASAPKEKRPADKEKLKDKSKSKGKDESKVHKLSLKGSSRLVAEFQRGVYPAEDFTAYDTILPLLRAQLMNIIS
ncbi:mitotic spindle checkpoint component mad2 [Trichoderma gamsii]|uniref:Mitotic spindle checkpoint component mad2 n=1 Tax=Trichoderma gamsii TaxID=398673 RepID=A0A2P4ZFI5_9HYPO|nr:mitotic spindle checkpoint component mad2 [Trichoderma gamsii]PON23060.1 mitotic spindle checkpoint component mad2 [Trichoderma gamsii]